MNKHCVDAATSGELIMNQVFETERGVYRLQFRRWLGEVYFFKWLNGELKEAHNLSQKKGKA